MLVYKFIMDLLPDHPKELIVCSVSGGKDSSAVYSLLVKKYGKNFLPLFADTGNEHPVTVNYVKNMHLFSGGPEVIIIEADFADRLAKRGKEVSGNPFLDLMKWKGRAPSTRAQFCTEWLKLHPQHLYLQEYYADRDWMMFSGIRQAESLKRKNGYPDPFTTNSYFDCDYVLPLLFESAETVFAILEEAGMPPNPLYALGYGRVGCFPCIHCTKKELSLLPDWAWDKLKHWESVIGRSWFSAGMLPKGYNYIPTIDEVRHWSKTKLGGKEIDESKLDNSADAPSCMSTWGICE